MNGLGGFYSLAIWLVLGILCNCLGNKGLCSLARVVNWIGFKGPYNYCTVWEKVLSFTGCMI